MRIAMLGTRGVPAHYGGFEIAVEEVGSRLADAGHNVAVYCRQPPGEPPPRYYRGMRLVNLPALKRRSLETLSHTALSLLTRSVGSADVALTYNAANAPFLPLIRSQNVPVATHVDGLEWKREKWGGPGRHYYRVAEQLAVRWSDVLIADAQGIADYYRDEFNAPTRLIAYGAPILRDLGHDRLDELGLSPRQYHLVVARFERENHVLEIVRGYVASRATLPLVVVGAAPYSGAYTAQVRAAADSRVRLIGSVWDQAQLDQLYANAFTYLHGHSVGGTNPSLLRAAGAGAHVIAFDVVFNREVLEDRGRYFAEPADVARAVEAAEADPRACLNDGMAVQSRIGRYSWDDVATRYERLCEDLASGNIPRPRPSGRRMR